MRDDKRTDEEKRLTRFYAVATDSFMSGWGLSPGRSLLAYSCRTLGEAEELRRYLAGRGEMRRARICGARWRPRLAAGDHLRIRGFSPGIG